MTFQNLYIDVNNIISQTTRSSKVSLLLISLQKNILQYEYDVIKVAVSHETDSFIVRQQCESVTDDEGDMFCYIMLILYEQFTSTFILFFN